MDNPISTLPNRLMVIKHAIRSGSRFFHSLFDGHPSIILVPAYFNGFYTFWRNNGTLPRKHLIEAFVAHFTFFFKEHPHEGFLGQAKLGINKDLKIGVEKDTFIYNLLQYLGENKIITRKKLFLATHYAYHSALGRSFESLSIIVFYAHGPTKNVLKEIVEDFPDTIFIHMLRSPIQALESCFKFYFMQKNHFLQNFELLNYVYGRTFFNGRIDFLEAYNNDRTKAIKLEELLSKPKQTLINICRFLEIPWDNNLMETIMDGKPFWYPRVNGELITGFEKKVVINIEEKTKNENFTWFDLIRLKILINPKHKKWRYDHKNWHGSILVRILLLPLLLFTFKMERKFYFTKFSDKLFINTLTLCFMIFIFLPLSPLLALATIMRLNKKKIKKIIPNQLLLWLTSHKILLRAWLMLFEKENKDLELLSDSTPSGFIIPVSNIII